jgi:ATP-binding cassette subfamily B protein
MKGLLRLFRLAWANRAGRRWIIASQLFLVAQVVFDLLIPQAIVRLVNVGLLGNGGQGDFDVVVASSVAMMLLAVASAVAATGVAWYAARFGEAAGHQCRRAVYGQVSRLSFGNIDRLRTSDLLVRLTTDVNQVRTVAMGVLTTLLRAPLMVVGAVIFLWFTSPLLAVVMLFMLPVVIAILAVYQRYGSTRYREVQEQFDDQNLVLQENLAGVRVVKAFVRAAYENQRFDESNRRLKATAEGAQRAQATLMPTLLLLINLGLAAALWIGGRDLLDGGGTNVGDIIAFTNYLVAIMVPLVLLSVLLPQMAAASSSLDGIFAVIDARPDVTFAPDAPTLEEAIGGPVKGRVAFEGVSFSYLDEQGRPHAVPVLADIDLVVEPGQTVAILGATGSGKTSLVNLIPRFYDVTAGRITIDGVDVRSVSRESLLAAVTPVLQQAMIFSGTIASNIRLGDPSIDRQDVVVAARVAQAASFVEERAQGYQEEVKRLGANFSGGQRQRLAIARAVARAPRILILDDSTSALDVATETRLQRALADELAGSTVFMVAQRISTALAADLIVLLDQGRVVAKGTHDELMASSELYRDIYESQLGEVPADA